MCDEEYLSLHQFGRLQTSWWSRKIQVNTRSPNDLDPTACFYWDRASLWQTVHRKPRWTGSDWYALQQSTHPKQIREHGSWDAYCNRMRIIAIDTFFFFKKKCIYLFNRLGDKERRRFGERWFICWFTPQVYIKAKTGPGWNRSLHFHWGNSTYVQGLRCWAIIYQFPVTFSDGLKWGSNNWSYH